MPVVELQVKLVPSERQRDQLPPLATRTSGNPSPLKSPRKKFSELTAGIPGSDEQLGLAPLPRHKVQELLPAALINRSPLPSPLKSADTARLANCAQGVYDAALTASVLCSGMPGPAHVPVDACPVFLDGSRWVQAKVVAGRHCEPSPLQSVID